MYFPVYHKECDVVLRSTVLCFGLFNEEEEEEQPHSPSPDMVLFDGLTPTFAPVNDCKLDWFFTVMFSLTLLTVALCVLYSFCSRCASLPD